MKSLKSDGVGSKRISPRKLIFSIALFMLFLMLLVSLFVVMASPAGITSAG